MPEGPEVAHTARLLAGYIGAVIIDLAIANEYNEITGLLPRQVTILDIWTYGKKIVFHMSNGEWMAVSLGMTGYFAYTPRDKDPWRVAWLTDRGPLYFGDVRKLGGFEVVSDIEYYLFVDKGLGPDLLRAAMGPPEQWICLDQWIHIFGGTARVCAVLTDQKRLAGVGNYLKSEILYFAGINPFRLVCSLSIEELDRLRYWAHIIIRKSYEHNGLTIATHISPDGSRGVYPCAVYHKHYDPHGYQVKSSGGNPNTFWVDELQS